MKLKNINKTHLKNLLLIKDLKKETIYSVIGRMEALLSIFHSNSELNHLIPFLQTYLFVTKRVNQKMFIKSGTYKNYRAMEFLDIYFASLYFKPLYEYLVNNKFSKPWMNYFTYCEIEFDSPFTQVLLGINVHINADLCQSIVDLRFDDDYDYELVNQILLETVSETMKYLAINEKDPFGLAGIFLNDFYKNEFDQVIVKWRNNALLNSTKVREDPKVMKEIQEKTDELGNTIVRLWENFYKPSNAITLLSQINSLEVLV